MRFSAETAVLLGLIGFGVGAFGTLIGPGGGFILTPILLLPFARLLYTACHIPDPGMVW